MREDRREVDDVGAAAHGEAQPCERSWARRRPRASSTRTGMARAPRATEGDRGGDLRAVVRAIVRRGSRSIASKHCTNRCREQGRRAPVGGPLREATPLSSTANHDTCAGARGVGSVADRGRFHGARPCARSDHHQREQRDGETAHRPAQPRRRRVAGVIERTLIDGSRRSHRLRGSSRHAIHQDDPSRALRRVGSQQLQLRSLAPPVEAPAPPPRAAQLQHVGAERLPRAARAPCGPLRTSSPPNVPPPNAMALRDRISSFLRPAAHDSRIVEQAPAVAAAEMNRPALLALRAAVPPLDALRAAPAPARPRDRRGRDLPLQARRRRCARPAGAGRARADRHRVHRPALRRRRSRRSATSTSPRGSAERFLLDLRGKVYAHVHSLSAEQLGGARRAVRPLGAGKRDHAGHDRILEHLAPLQRPRRLRRLRTSARGVPGDRQDAAAGPAARTRRRGQAAARGTAADAPHPPAHRARATRSTREPRPAVVMETLDGRDASSTWSRDARPPAAARSSSRTSALHLASALAPPARARASCTSTSSRPTSSPRPGRAKVIDLSHARPPGPHAAGQRDLVLHGARAGARRRGRAAAADVWGLGIVLYAAATAHAPAGRPRRRPRRRTTPSSHAPRCARAAAVRAPALIAAARARRALGRRLPCEPRVRPAPARWTTALADAAPARRLEASAPAP